MEHPIRKLSAEEKAHIYIQNIQQYTFDENANIAFEKLKQDCSKEVKKEANHRTERDGRAQLTINTKGVGSNYQKTISKSNQQREENFIKRYEEKSTEILKKHDPNAYEKFLDDQAEIHAFNHGYLAEKYDHEVARLFDINKSEHLKDYQKSFNDGRAQRFKEKDIETLEKYKSVKKDLNLEPSKNKQKNRGKDYERE